MRIDGVSRPRRFAAGRPLDGAEAALLSWLIGLPDGVDPARAARFALAAMRPADEDCPRQSRLRALLAEVGGTPAAALPRPVRRRSARRFC
jgi:hypothetical protein